MLNIIRRFPLGSVRSFATSKEGPAVQKIKVIFEEYRKQNYSMEIPSRYRKELLKAADVDGDGIITSAEIEKVLKNIGNSSLTMNEIEEVVQEISVKAGKDEEVGVEAEDFFKLL